MSTLEREELRTLEHFVNLIEPGEREHDTRKARFDRAYDVYRATPPKGVRKQQWESQLRIRYGQQVIDTELVNIAGGNPKTRVRPRRPQDAQTAPKMQVVLDYHAGEDHLNEKIVPFSQQALIYGVTGAKNSWLYRETTRPVRTFMPNPFDAELPLDYSQNDRVILRDGPTFEPWDMYELFWEPHGRTVDDCRYVVLGSWLTRDEILERTVSERNPYGMFDPDAALKLLELGPASQPSLTAHERHRGGNQNRYKDRFHVYEIWRETPAGLMWTILGEHKAVLKDEPTPFAHGQKPVVLANIRPDMFSIEGFSDTELVDHIQQAMQTIEQATLDNLHMTVHRGFTYRETGIPDVRSLVVKPRFMWPVTDHDDIRPLDMPQLGADTFRMKEELMGRLQLVTGVNPYITGSEMAGVDQTTATGVSVMNAAANALLRFKAREIGKAINRTFEQWGELVQQFMDRKTAVRIEGPNGFDWTNVDPQEIAGDYDFAVEGIEEAVSKQQEQANALGLLNAFGPFAGVPGVNMRPVLERVAKVYDMPADVIFQQPSGPAPASPNGGGGGSLPAGDARIGQNSQSALVGGQQLPPGVLEQIQRG